MYKRDRYEKVALYYFELLFIMYCTQLLKVTELISGRFMTKIQCPDSLTKIFLSR